MVLTKTAPDYSGHDTAFKPGPKNGHYSELDPEFKKVQPMADMMIDAVWEPNTSLEDFRLMWLHNSAAPKGSPKEGQDVVTSTSSFKARDGADIEVKIYKSWKQESGSPLVMRYHGGGWVVGGHCTENTENLIIAERANGVVISVDYRMAPEHRFPVAAEDCFDGLKWAKENAAKWDADPNKIIIAGGSAGSQLAAVVALMARDEGVKGVVGQILNFPVACHPKYYPTDKYEMKSIQQNANASVVNAVRMEWFIDHYMPDPSADWRMSPLLAESLAGLPPTLAQVGGADLLRDEGIAYSERLKSEGVDVDMTVYQGLPHCFYMFVALPQTKQYYDKVVDFIKKVSA